MSTMIQDPGEVVDPNKPRQVTLVLDVSRSALELVAADFNPGHSNDVGKAKLLAACIITMAENLRDRPHLEPGEDSAPNVPNRSRNEALKRGARNAAMAISEFEIGAMLLVKAATR